MSDVHFQTFPGTTSFFAARTLTNLIDSDTAHSEQGLGLWVNAVGSSTPSQSTALTPLYGTKHLKWANAGTTPTPAIYCGVGVAPRPVVSPATEYTISYDGAASAAGYQLRGGVRWLDAAGAMISDSHGSYFPVGTAFGTRVHATFTSPALAAFASPWFTAALVAGGDIATGPEYYADEICFGEGTSTEFAPSPIIVGDDETEMVAALTDWTPAAAMVLWDDGATKCTVDTAGDFTFEMWGDTTTAMTPLSALVNGESYTIKVTGVESTGVFTFYIDGVSQDTDTLTPGTPTYADLSVCADTAGSNAAAADVYTLTRRDGIAGPIAAKWDAADAFREAN